MNEIICTLCPRGCRMSVNAQAGTVSGNRCNRGRAYGLAEAVNPVRTVTSSVRLAGGGRLPVKTSAPIPRSEIFRLMDVIHGINVSPPIKAGCVIITDVLGMGVDLVATDCAYSVTCRD